MYIYDNLKKQQFKFSVFKKNSWKKNNHINFTTSKQKAYYQEKIFNITDKKF